MRLFGWKSSATKDVYGKTKVLLKKCVFAFAIDSCNGVKQLIQSCITKVSFCAIIRRNCTSFFEVIDYSINLSVKNVFMSKYFTRKKCRSNTKSAQA